MIKPRRKILVIDDDPGTLKLLDKWLKLDGYDVFGALDGKTGLETAKAQMPDLIVLDLMIPDMNGVDIARKLKSMPLTAEIPIVVITVTMGVENDKGDEKIEVDGYFFPAFAKPLHSRKLLSTIRKEINKHINRNV